MRTSLKRRFGKAFTLIELLIVITIIGILAVALIPRVTQGPAKARDVKRKSDVQNIGTSLELYYSDSASYPTGDGCAGTTLTAALTTGSTSYTQAIPDDPTSTSSTLGCAGGYYYKALGTTPNFSSFALVSKLERAAGGDNIYCNVQSSTITSAYATTLTALNLLAPTTECLEGEAYYVILR